MAETGGDAELVTQVLENIGGDKRAEKRRQDTPYGGGGGLPPAAPPAPTPRGVGQLCDTRKADVQDRVSVVEGRFRKFV